MTVEDAPPTDSAGGAFSSCWPRCRRWFTDAANVQYKSDFYVRTCADGTSLLLEYGGGGSYQASTLTGWKVAVTGGVVNADDGTTPVANTAVAF